MRRFFIYFIKKKFEATTTYPATALCWSTDDLVWGASNSLTWPPSSSNIRWSTDVLEWGASNTLTWG